MKLVHSAYAALALIVALHAAKTAAQFREINIVEQ